MKNDGNIWLDDAYKIEKWKLIKDESAGADSKHHSVKYFRGKDSDHVVQINEFSDGIAKVQFIEEKVKVKEKPDKEGNVQKEKSSTIYKEEEIPLGLLYSFISEHKLQPDESYEYKEESDPVPRKWEFWSQVFSNRSVLELVMSGKLVIDSIEKFLGEWRDEQSAKLANSLFGKLLPEELQKDLKSRVQQEQKKRRWHTYTYM